MPSTQEQRRKKDQSGRKNVQCIQPIVPSSTKAALLKHPTRTCKKKNRNHEKMSAWFSNRSEPPVLLTTYTSTVRSSFERASPYEAPDSHHSAPSRCA